MSAALSLTYYSTGSEYDDSMEHEHAQNNTSFFFAEELR
jgi:hypothetical protein